jgi:hypothetical protein
MGVDCSFTPTLSGDMTVHTLLDGCHVARSPVEIRVDPGEVDASHTTSTPRWSGSVVAGSTATVTVVCKDRFGNVCPASGGIDGFASLAAGKRKIPAKTIDNNDGTCTLTLVCNEAGRHAISVCANKKDIVGSPLLLEVVSAPVCASQCSAEGRGLEPGLQAGQSASFVVRTADQYGNERRSGGERVLVTVQGPAPVATSVHDNADGTYAVQYTCTHTGLYHCTVLVNGSAIRDSPFSVDVGASAVHVPSCKVTGDGLSRCIAGQRRVVHVSLLDAYGNASLNGYESLQVALTGDEGDAIAADVTGDGSGRFAAEYTVLASGEYKLSILINGTHAPRSGTVVVVDTSDCEPKMCRVVWERPSRLVAGEPIVLSVHAHDEYGSRLHRGGDVFDVKLGGRAEIVGRVVDNQDGTYTASFTPTLSGSYMLAVSNQGRAVQSSPIAVEVQPAASRASHSYVVNSASCRALQVAVAGEQGTFRVQTADEFGNDCCTGGDSVAIVLLKEGKRVKGVVKDNGNGTYDVQYVATISGRHEIHMILNSLHIRASPATLQVHPAGIEARHCVLTLLSGPSAQAGAEIHFRLQAKDAFSNLLSSGGAVVTLLREQPGTNHSASFQDHGDGTYTVSTQVTKSGVAKFRAEANNQATETAPIAVNIVAGESAGAKCVVIERVPAVAGEKATLRIRAHDAHGNERRVGGDHVHVDVQGPSATAAAVSDCGDGTYSASYTCTVSGTYHVHVSVNGCAIADSPFETVVEPAATSAAHCLVEWTGVKSAVAGEGFSFKVEARDRFLNKRGVGGDAFRLQSAQRMQTSTKDHGDGSYTVSCTLFEAGSNTCCVMLGDGAEGVCADGMRADVTAAGVDVKNCRVSGAGLKGARAGEVGEVVVMLSDRYGNLRSSDSGVVALRIEADGALVLSATGVFDRQLHGYLLRYTLNSAGTYSLVVGVGTLNLTGFPLSIPIRPAERDLRTTFVQSESLTRPHRVGDAIEYMVQARDAFENHVLASSGQLTCVYVASGVRADGVVTDNGNGTYTCRWRIPSPIPPQRAT